MQSLCTLATRRPPTAPASRLANDVLSILASHWLRLARGTWVHKTPRGRFTTRPVPQPMPNA